MVEASTRYEPGSWVGVVRSGRAVFLQPDADPALVSTVWELLGMNAEAHEVLHAVTNSSGSSLAQIPSFGIVDFKDSLRVFLRGDIELTAELATGSVELNGRDVTTWTERRLADPQRWSAAVSGEGDGARERGAELPLREGVVLLKRLLMDDCEPGGVVAAPDAGTATGEPPQDTGFAQTEVSHETVIGIQDEDFSYTSYTSADSKGSAHAPHDPVEEPDVAGQVPDVPGGEAEAPSDEPDIAEQAPDVAEPAPDVPGQAPDVAGQEPDAPGEEAEAPADEPDIAEQAPEMTSSYDHLWEKTVVRTIEDAAVREGPEDAEPPKDHSAEQPLIEPTEQPPAVPVAQQPAAPVAAAPGGSGTSLPEDGLIDSVPWRTAGLKTAGLSQNLPWTPPSFTVSAAVQPQREQPQREQPPVSPSVEDSDHDGETILKSDLGSMPAGPVAPGGDAAGNAVGPTVLARVCRLGHANPPTNSQCSSCGELLPDDAVQVRRPPLGRMRVSTGELIDLDQSLIVGRQPSVSRVQGSVMPKLVQVASPSGDISRSHVEVRLEGWHVMLCDLKATNGTVLVREGQQPRRLAQGEMAILLDGDIAELGDDVSLRFEEIL